MPQVAEPEGDPVQVQAEELGGRARTAACQDVHVIEDAQDVSQAEEEDEQEERPQIEELDVAELRP